MSKFVETEDGTFVLSSEIVRVRNHGYLVCTITTRSGESYAVTVPLYQRILGILSFAPHFLMASGNTSYFLL